MLVDQIRGAVGPTTTLCGHVANLEKLTIRLTQHSYNWIGAELGNKLLVITVMIIPRLYFICIAVQRFGNKILKSNK